MESLQHDRTNLIQLYWTGYTSSKRTALHRRFCGYWGLMRGGGGLLGVEGVEHVEGF